jgi:hypothetical protein
VLGRVLRRCKSCARTQGYITLFPAAVAARSRGVHHRKVQRVWAICYLGGKCKSCGVGYDGRNGYIFDFHHRDPAQKEFAFNRVRTTYAALRRELDKCDLLCCACHRGEHSEPY